VVLGKTMSLGEAVKRIGGSGRIEKMWRAFASNTVRDRYDRMKTERNKESELRREPFSFDLYLKSNDAARVAGALRSAVAEGNSTRVEAASHQS